MDVTFALLQQMSVYLVVAYLFSKTPIFDQLFTVAPRQRHRLVVYVVFSAFCILGTYLSLEVHGAIANNRAIGAVMGGLLGGPAVGLAVGITGGLHRYTLGGFTDLACAVSTTVDGLIGGLVHIYYLRQRRPQAIFSPWVPFLATLGAECLQMLIILAVARPFADAVALVRVIAAPMILCNAVGAGLFMAIIRDRRNMFEKFGNIFSNKALRIAESAVGLAVHQFDRDTAETIARIVFEETGVGAVSITDRERILAYVGRGSDHHRPDTPISSDLTRQAIAENRVVFADGFETPFACSIDDHCPLGSALVVPLRGDGEVLGCIKLYEPKGKLFLNINRRMGEGIARLLAANILAGRFEQQKTLLLQAELKLVQAQVNPHFLFNTLNTIGAVTRIDPDRARQLLMHLSNFFRKNLKRASDVSTLREELDHVRSYLEIEQARYGDRLQVAIRVDDRLLDLRLPTFTLQPLVENAVKHGISTMLSGGRIGIFGWLDHGEPILLVEDNAGCYCPAEGGSGLGLSIVDKRLQAQLGGMAGIEVACRAGAWTRVSIRIPRPAVAA